MENLKELVLLRKLVNEKGKSLSVEESRKIQTTDGEYHKSKVKAYWNMAYLMLFPEAEHENWAQIMKIMDLHFSGNAGYRAVSMDENV